MWDCHCHLADPAWSDGAAEPRAAARRLGVRGWLSCATDPDSWELQERLAGPGVVLAQGLHPWHLPDDLTSALRRLERVLQQPSTAAVGECGLDYLRARSPEAKERQLQALQAQLQLAERYGLPVVLHCVRAQQALLQELERWGPNLRVMVHGFLGSLRDAELWLERGAYLSLGPHAIARSDLMTKLPLDRVLVETDAPSRGASLLDLIQLVRAWQELQPLADDHFEQNLRRFLGRPLKGPADEPQHGT